MLPLGEQIRRARLQAGMTQKDLCGDRITRNMLSLIENGKANPSIATIAYLTERLELPSGFFFSESDDETAVRKLSVIEQIREAYRTEQYEECLSLCRPFLETDEDELLLIGADCSLQTGIDAYRKGQFDEAVVCLSDALTFSNRCCYRTEWIDAEAVVYFDLIRDIGYFPSEINARYHQSTDFPAMQIQFYRKLTSLLDAGDSKSAEALYATGFLTDRTLAQYIEAVLSARHSDFSGSVQQLENLLDERGPETLDLPFRFRILNDLEQGYKELEQYAKAEYCSNEKQSLLKQIRLPT